MTAIATLTLDSECVRLIAEFKAYVTSPDVTIHGLVHDATLTGALSRWADSACTVPIEHVVAAEALAVVDSAGPEVPLVVTDPDMRARLIARAEHIAQGIGLPAERMPALYLAATRVGLRKFAGMIRAQKEAGQ